MAFKFEKLKARQEALSLSLEIHQPTLQFPVEANTHDLRNSITTNG